MPSLITQEPASARPFRIFVPFRRRRDRAVRVPGVIVLVVDDGAVVGQQLFLKANQLFGVGDVIAFIGELSWDIVCLSTKGSQTAELIDK